MNGHRLFIKFLLLSFLTAAISPTLCFGIEIVYPSDLTFIDDSNYLIVRCGVDPVVNSVVVTVGDIRSDPFDISAPDYRAVWGDMLILAPEFDPGENHVIVEGITGGKLVGKAEIDLFFVDGLQNHFAPEKFSPYVMHTPARERLCERCHNMNPSTAEMNIQSIDGNPCVVCHARKLEVSYVHGPAGVYQCGYCHDPQSRPEKYQLRAREVSLCFGCHSDKKEQFGRMEHVHGPVQVGLCTVCHDAHSGENPSQLKLETNTLCLSCHERVLTTIHIVRGVSGRSHPLSGVPDPSNSEQMLSCVSCHDPHSGTSSQYFREEISSRYELCAICHKR